MGHTHTSRKEFDIVYDEVTDGNFESLSGRNISWKALQHTDKSGRTLLHSAVIKGRKDIVSLLIERGANVNERGQCGELPLHEAVIRNMVDIVTLLIDNGAYVNAKGFWGRSPIDEARRIGSPHLVKILMDAGADVITDSFYSAASQKKELSNDVMNGVINKGVYIRNRESSTASRLHSAIKAGSLERVKCLIGRGANVNSRYGNGRSLLHDAVVNGEIDIAKFLVAVGADVNAKCELYRTPLHNAVNTDNVDVVAFLLDHGADIHADDYRGSTPQDEAMTRVMNGKLDKSVLWQFLAEGSVLPNELKDRAYRLVRCGYGLNSQHEVDIIARQLVNHGQYDCLLYMISAGLYPDVDMVRQCLHRRERLLEAISEADAELGAECLTRLTEVRTLHTLCRDKIRQTIWRHNSHINLIAAVHRMTMIPQRIQDVITCESEDCAFTRLEQKSRLSFKSWVYTFV